MKKYFIYALAALGMLACTGQNSPENPSQPTGKTIEGELTGVISVSPSKKVHFSQGNLQYQASTNTWRFAKYQFEFAGAANEQASATYSGWIDLFGWGTSGYNNRLPYSAYEYNQYEGIDNIAGTNYDWGVYNKISNGGNEAGLWRTLTGDEWEYIFRGRKDAEYLFALGTVNDVNGLIILPDNWKTPADLTFNASTQKGFIWDEDKEHSIKYYYNPSENASNYNDNIYTNAEWEKMETAGAVFLPIAGCKIGEGIGSYNNGESGSYWSSSFGNVNKEFDCGAHLIYFGANVLYVNMTMTIGNISVRLVRDIK